ncbi:ecdysteroid-phosphate phosphatase-like [Macrobrachium rosenbergii]|uniref:ecdysteroid-phosphate phosphatase-like n=1 Tax=Macrobrachium rosenbergii TaxID=79674 RepID=UPI0034D663AD
MSHLGREPQCSGLNTPAEEGLQAEVDGTKASKEVKTFKKVPDREERNLKRKEASVRPRRHEAGKVTITTFLVTRHAERLDSYLRNHNEEWNIENIQDHYKALPKEALPRRKRMADYVRDTPLTEDGIEEATKFGKTIAANGLRPFIYCSPACRCVQTARAIAAGAKISAPIRIEPGLHERTDRPLYTVSIEEYKRNAYFNIDMEYEPLMAVEKIDLSENSRDFQRRQADVTAHLIRDASALQRHSDDSDERNCLLMVACFQCWFRFQRSNESTATRLVYRGPHYKNIFKA